MTGPVRPEVEKFSDLKPRELWAVGPLIVLIIVFGFFPQPLLNIINPAVRHTLVQVHATDPVPPHPARVTARISELPRRGTTVHLLRQKGTTP
jgi:NADH-quinone oxidoreductase subunit M